MKGEGYVSLFPKKLPTLATEWVTSSYLAKNLARFIARLATWVMNSAQNCQLLVLRLGFRLVALAGDTLPYSPNPSRARQPYTEGTNISPSLHYFIIEAVNQQRQESFITINALLFYHS
jgi:hypothetical protein